MNLIRFSFAALVSLGAAMVPAPCATPAPASLPSLVLRGDVAGIETLLRSRVDAHGDDRETAEALLAYLAAIAHGRYDAAEAELRELHARGEPMAAGLLARLVALRGSMAEAVRIARAIDANDGERRAVLRFVLAWSPDPDRAARAAAAAALLESDPFDPRALEEEHLEALARGDRAAAASAWESMHLGSLDPTASGRAERAVAAALRSTAAADWNDLCELYASCGHFEAARECERHVFRAGGHASAGAAARVAAGIAAIEDLHGAWRRAALRGFLEDDSDATLGRAFTTMGRRLLHPDESLEDLVDRLREDHRSILVFPSADPLHVRARWAGIRAEREVIVNLGDRSIRAHEVVLRAPYADGSDFWRPFLGRADIHGYHLARWPRTIVIDAHVLTDGIATTWRGLCDPKRAPWSPLPPEADAPAADDLAPAAVAVSYLASDRGNRCLLESARWTAREAALDVTAGSAGRATSSTSFLHAFARHYFRARRAEVLAHEARHALDRIEEEEHPDAVHRTRAERERRAYLAQLRFAPPASQYRTLAVIATGANPASIGSSTEQANLELLEGFVLELLRDPKLAPAVDRERNLQLQLHLLRPADIAEIARRIEAR